MMKIMKIKNSKQNIKYLTGLVILSLTFGIQVCISQTLPKIRDVAVNPIDIQNNNYLNKDYNASQKNNIQAKSNYKAAEINQDEIYSKAEASLKKGGTDLSALVGRSHLIRFDIPVKRISITNPALADLMMLSPKELLLNGKAAGITSLIIWGEKGDPVFFDLVVKNDATTLLNAVKALTPNENINVKFTDDLNAIFSGKMSSVITKEKLKNITLAYGYKFVDLIEAPTPQVVLEVKVAEASRAFTKNFKANFAVGSYSDTFKFGVIPDSAKGPAQGSTFDGTLNGIKSFFVRGDFTAVLTAAEQKGIVKVLAEPKLVSTHGNKASFNAGQEVPVPTGVDQNGNLSYEYKNIGVSIAFTPVIQEKSQRILLNIVPEVSEIDSTTTVTQNNGSVIYGFKTRKAETTVDLKSGQTIVIAGLFQRSDNNTKTQIPLMGDIPIIGKLFGSSEYKKGETELMIFVTPKIIDSNSLSNGV
jgi:pilus assembly protein CpaC